MELKPRMQWGLMALLSLSVGGAFVLFSGLVEGVGSSSIQGTAARREERVQIFAGGVVEGTGAPLALRFEATGRIARVLVREGEAVKAGQVLAELDSEAAEWRLTQAEAELNVAQMERDRLISGMRQESKTVMVSSSSSPGDLAIAYARTTGALAVVKQMQLQVRNTRLIAPTSGIIVAVPLAPGELVGPDSAAEPLMMVNRDQTRVRAFVEELDALDVAIGQSVVVVASGRADKKYRGSIVSCSPYVRPKSHRHLNPGERLDVRVREVVIELDDGADLLIGLPVEVFIDPQAFAAETALTRFPGTS